MDTIQIIKINENQILVALNTKKNIKLDLKFSDLKNLIRRINHILNDYIDSGANSEKLSEIKKKSYELFNILNFFEFKDYFEKLKKNKNKISHIQLFLDRDTNYIPIEILHDGKDFLSDYLIFSRLFIDLNNQSQNKNLINSNEVFSIVSNPSESDDIDSEANDECRYISDLIEPTFDLRGPYRKRYVNKIELIHLLGISSCFHFSGHYKTSGEKVGWKLFDDIFTSTDIQKTSKSPNFIFSNSCGGSSEKFINSFLKKGTQSIIASLGKLPSERATEFSKIFYKYFIAQNLSLGESFFLSRKDMINRYGKDDLFWCFYQIYGSSVLRINPTKTIKKIRTKFNFIRLSISLIVLSIISLFMYNNFYSYDTKDSSFILNQLTIMNNGVKVRDYSKIDLQNLRAFKINQSDSIYFKTSNGKPIFSFNKNFEGLDIFINDSLSIEKLISYKNDTLNLFLNNKKNYNNSDYYKVVIDLGFLYKDIQFYIRKIDFDIYDYDLTLIDQYSYNRYKIKLSKLIDLSNKFPVITKDQLDQNSDFSIKASTYYGTNSLDLIKDDLTFNKKLTLYVKKALIK
mgnify:CR=1 FL=1